MAIAFVRGNVISRQKGQSVVASAAYRACERLRDERHCRDPDYKDPDYSAKSGHLAGGLILPGGVKWTREELWNAVEAFEKRIDARLAKELMVALPKELSNEENKALAEDIAKLVSKEIHSDGSEDEYCVDWNMHAPHEEAVCDEEGNYILDENGKKRIQKNDNIHEHILITERAWDSELGTFRKLKDRTRNSKEWMADIKLKIGELMNQRLRAKGLPEVDFRSFDVRNAESVEKNGKELDAPQKHKGPIKTNMDRKRRRRINKIKRELKMVQDELNRLYAKEKAEKTAKNKLKPSAKDKVDLFAWKTGDESIVEPKNNKTGKVEKTTYVSTIPKIQSIQKPKPKPTLPAIELPVPTPIRGNHKSGSAKHNGGPEVRCIICGIIEKPECHKCRYWDEVKDVFLNSGYEM